MLKIPVYLQILFDVNLNFIEQFDFLEIFCYFGGINLSEKCVNVSCCVVFDCGQNEPDQQRRSLPQPEILARFLD